MNRTEIIEELNQGADEVWDFIVIGGGASGLGTAVDAASRGYKTLLLEQHDFAKGTSSRSTKLVHGGVRYLKQGNISLVLDALKERGLLAQNAAHLVSPLPFIVPLYHWWEGPFYGIGLKVYDKLAGDLGLKPSSILSVDETVKHIPTVETEGLIGGVMYYDAQFDDARLAINLMQSIYDNGGIALNYCKVIGFLKQEKMITGVMIKDEESGECFEVEGKVVVNATGVFSDGVRSLDTPGAEPAIAVSQGVHVVLPREYLPGDSAIMVPRTSDGRVLFAVPWHEHVVLGTTDGPVDHIDVEPEATDEEVNFILSNADNYLDKKPSTQDVLSIFAGLRPLVKGGDGNMTSGISRDHSIHVSDSGLVSILGGKWTTYRKMAEDTVDQAEGVVGFEHRSCCTVSLKLHGSAGDGAPCTTDDLGHYGSDAQGVRDLIEASPELAQRLHEDLPYSRAEVIWAVRYEMARTVEDVLARRLRALFLNARASMMMAVQVADLIAVELGYDDEWKKKAVRDFELLARNYILH